jgi:hypothetical protein
LYLRAMDRLFKYMAFFVLAAGVFISCKKHDNSTQNAPPTVATSFVVDDTAVANPSHTTFTSSGNYGIIIYGPSGTPEVQIVFYGSQAPTSGTYLITSSPPNLGTCNFTFSNSQGNSPATNGSVNITWNGSPKNVASFSNIQVGGSGGHHKVTATFTY